MPEPKSQYLDKHGLQLYDELLKHYINKEAKIYYDTTENWDKKPDLITESGSVYIYSDWGRDPVGRLIAGFKVGDGETRLLDLPFTDQMYADHINDTVSHITQQERTDWNNKITCFYVKDLERVIFAK
jgi:hypothetical protein